MDTWGFYAIIAGALVYWLLKKQRLGMFLMGAGVGIVVAAVGAYLLIMSKIP